MSKPESLAVRVGEGKAEVGGEGTSRHQPVLAASLALWQEFVLSFINQELRVYGGG